MDHRMRIQQSLDYIEENLKAEITAAELAEKSPCEKTILISMINGGQKYMPDAKSYARITWEAQNSMMMPGAAEAWVNRVVEILHEMRGENTHE